MKSFHLKATHKVIAISAVVAMAVISAIFFATHNTSTPIKSKNVSATTNSSKVADGTQNTTNSEPATSSATSTTAQTTNTSQSAKTNSTTASASTGTTTPTQNNPTQPTQPTTPTTPAKPDFTLTLHPENAAVHTYPTIPDYSYYEIPYTLVLDPGLGGMSSMPDCTILNTPLLYSHIWCVVGEKGSVIAIQYDTVAVPGHYKMQTTFVIGDVTHSASAEFDLQ
jgi:hypothetical protein